MSLHWTGASTFARLMILGAKIPQLCQLYV